MVDCPHMEKFSSVPTENETSLRNKPDEGIPDGFDDLDTSEPRKTIIQKVTHSNTIERESVEKIKSELISHSSFLQSKMACACGIEHTITLSDDGTAHSFGRNKEGALGLGHNNDVSLPTPIPDLPQINMISCGDYFTVCVDSEGFIWSFGENNAGQLGTGNKTNFNVPQKNSQSSSCSFCILWIRSHIDHHKRFKFVVMWEK